MTKLFATLAGTIVFSTLIAGFLSAIGFGGGFAINLVFSQCIGLSIAMLLLAVLHANLPPLLRGLAAAAGIVVGAALGGFLG
ncbi:MAG: hypothetical protein JNK59_11265, partial [Sterolibacteriaceae bacterium]|nr:hypothetical protein [Sterolibacteriaceae bacterium]